jgi:DHA2 family multidrug resistance protein
MHRTYSTLIEQASFLAYKDVFLYCAFLAFGFVPLTFLFSPVKAKRKAGAE